MVYVTMPARCIRDPQRDDTTEQTGQRRSAVTLNLKVDDADAGDMLVPGPGA